MSSVIAKNHQVGNSLTSTDNLTIYQPSTPDGTLRIGAGNAGATTADLVTLTSAGNLGIGNTPTEKLDVTGNFKLSGAATLSAGTANGVAYLNGSKVLTSGSALTFDGTNLGLGGAVTAGRAQFTTSGTPSSGAGLEITYGQEAANTGGILAYNRTAGTYQNIIYNAAAHIHSVSGTEAMRLTSSSLYTASGINVGIGVSFPTSALYVLAQSDTAGGAGITIGNSAANRRWLTRFGTNTDLGYYLDFYDGSSWANRLALTYTGNLGLGVTPSAWDSAFKAFQLNTTGAVASTSNRTFVGQNWYDSASGAKYIANGYALRYDQIGANGSHAWYVSGTSAGTAGASISTFTQAMTLDASGNVQIGTTGNYGTNVRLALYRSAMPELVFADDTTPSAAAAPRIAGGSTYMTFSTNGSERARINSGGFFKASDTGAYYSSTGVFHELRSSATDTQTAIFSHTAASPYGVIVRYTGASPNNTDNWFLYCDDSGGTQRASIKSNGGLYNYQANNSNLSDRREKTNFAPAKSYLETICAIPVQTFNYIDQNMEDDPGLTLGVVAQDVQAVAPELVMESNWGTKDEPKMRLSIYQTDLQYALMKCIQEQQALITSLTARIAALEAQ